MGRRAGYKAVHKLRVHPPLLPVRFGALLYSRMLLHLVIDASQETRGPLPARQMLPQLSSLSQQRGLQASSRCRSCCILHHIQCFIIFSHFQAERPVQAAIATATITFTLMSLSASGLTSHTVADLRYCRSSMPQDKASDLGKTPAPSPQKAPYTFTVIFELVVPFLRSTSKKRRPYQTSSSERLSQPTDIEEHIFAHCSSGAASTSAENNFLDQFFLPRIQSQNKPTFTCPSALCMLFCDS